MVSVHFIHSSFMSLMAGEKPEIKAKADQQKNTETVRGSMQIYTNEQRRTGQFIGPNEFLSIDWI